MTSEQKQIAKMWSQRLFVAINRTGTAKMLLDPDVARELVKFLDSIVLDPSAPIDKERANGGYVEI